MVTNISTSAARHKVTSLVCATLLPFGKTTNQTDRHTTRYTRRETDREKEKERERERELTDRPSL